MAAWLCSIRLRFCFKATRMLQFESLGLIEAEKGIAGGLQAASGLGKAMAFAVADHSGEMIATARMDGAKPRILRHAIRKAYTAARMCRHTLSFKRDLEEREGGLDQWGDPNLTTLPGGLVVQSGDQFVGGVGTGGGGADDEAVARAMVKAMGFAVMEDRRSL
jgi:glc operon protein GlcG